MPILASILYGSRARGDNKIESDTDLLMVTDEVTIVHNNTGKLSISFYPFKNLVQRAETGDLFLYHVLREGQTIYDSNDIIATLNSNFQFRKSYNKEKTHANDIGWLIVKFSDALSKSPILGRRLAWCVRTILISNSAEGGRPVFSARELAELAPQNEILELIAQKDSNSLSPFIINELKRFLLKFELSDPLPGALSENEFAARFLETGNTLGLNFLETKNENETEYI